MIQTTVATLLHQLGLGVYQPDGAGGDLFIDLLPDQPDGAVQIRALGGPQSSAVHPYTTVRVQLLVRGGRDPRDAQDRAHALDAAMHGRRNETLPDGTYLVGCHAVGPPSFVDVDDSLRVTYSLHLMCETQDPTDNRGGW